MMHFIGKVKQKQPKGKTIRLFFISLKISEKGSTIRKKMKDKFGYIGEKM